jgi:hypothetical protein
MRCTTNLIRKIPNTLEVTNYITVYTQKFPHITEWEQSWQTRPQKVSVAGNSQHDVIPLFHTTNTHPHNEARIYFSYELNHSLDTNYGQGVKKN